MEESFGTLKPFLVHSSLLLGCHGMRISFYYGFLLYVMLFYSPKATGLAMARGPDSSKHVLQYKLFLFKLFVTVR